MKEDRFGTDKCPIGIYETCVKCPHFYRCEGRYGKVEVKKGGSYEKPED